MGLAEERAKATPEKMKEWGCLYEPNTAKWSPGDFVIYDGDAKETRMLIFVLGYDRAGKCVGQYVYLDDYKNRPGWIIESSLCYLHDPRRFDISLPSLDEVYQVGLKRFQGGQILSAWNVEFMRMAVTHFRTSMREVVKSLWD